MISNLNEDGTLEPLSGCHYGHSGHFIGNDSIYISLGGFGGLGGGWNYKIWGKK
ncbi:MAG: hypothetical protein ACPG21_09620 [Crocinitomicaceae bacterium]